uniref:Uncharacterized protein n=1 Tax=Spongospora subterranea TaxID=70186 RepID=A0A0H5QFH3_9EUKA|eukprot:CRZ00783.1 hypothetical protein [Spongospora subterranea]
MMWLNSSFHALFEVNPNLTNDSLLYEFEMAIIWGNWSSTRLPMTEFSQSLQSIFVFRLKRVEFVSEHLQIKAKKFRFSSSFVSLPGEVFLFFSKFASSSCVWL